MTGRVLRWVLPLALVLVAPASASALPKVLTGQYDDGNGFQLKPKSIVSGGDYSSVMGGPDGRSGFDPGSLDWTTYTRNEGVAVGRIWLNECRPGCKRGTFTASDVWVRVSRPRDGHFTRMRYRYRNEDGGRSDTRTAIRHNPDGWYFELITD